MTYTTYIICGNCTNFLSQCTVHSVEKYSKSLSQFLGEKSQFFRQIDTNLSISSFYYIKLTWENANSKFLRKFAQEMSTNSNKGGSNLID